jgi:hypothetical protein
LSVGTQAQPSPERQYQEKHSLSSYSTLPDFQ